jgi:lipopolysaccharide export system protein LptC
VTASATPTPELHLPDLPEVPVSLGPLAPGSRGPHRRTPWPMRLRDGLSTYLPLLLMALLAGGTWWLVKHTPGLEIATTARPVRSDPDYTMRGFNLTRFAPDGRFAVRVEGDVLRHFPDTDRLEIEGVRIESVSPDGRTTRASANRALANGDVSEVQLLGNAKVVAQLGANDSIELDSEFLHAFVNFERLRSNQPVVVRRVLGPSSSVTHAGGLNYDHLNNLLQLDGPVRAQLPPVSKTPAKR